MNLIDIKDVVLSIGSNKGNRVENISRVKRELLNYAKILKVSRILENKPEDYESDNLFLNQLLKITTPLNPFELLFELKKIEQKMGRINRSIDGVYEDRVIDIDIIHFRGLVLNTHYLSLPHSENIKREFYYKLIKDLN